MLIIGIIFIRKCLHIALTTFWELMYILNTCLLILILITTLCYRGIIIIIISSSSSTTTHTRIHLLISREKVGVRKKHQWERKKHWLAASCMHPDWGPNPKPRHVPCVGIEPATLWVHWTMLQPTEPLGQAGTVRGFRQCSPPTWLGGWGKLWMMIERYFAYPWQLGWLTSYVKKLCCLLRARRKGMTSTHDVAVM